MNNDKHFRMLLIEAANELSHQIVEARRLQAIFVHSDGDARETAWQAVLAFAPLWALRHDGDYSVINMNHSDIRAAILEDIVFVEDMRRQGAVAHYPVSTLVRHLGTVDCQNLRQRIIYAMQCLVEDSILVIHEGELEVMPGMFQEVEAESGVYLLSDEETASFDYADKLLSVGGAPLLAEELSELLQKAADLDNEQNYGHAGPL